MLVGGMIVGFVASAVGLVSARRRFLLRLRMELYRNMVGVSNAEWAVRLFEDALTKTESFYQGRKR
jgi:hypothetical protein